MMEHAVSVLAQGRARVHAAAQVCQSEPDNSRIPNELFLFSTRASVHPGCPHLQGHVQQGVCLSSCRSMEFLLLPVLLPPDHELQAARLSSRVPQWPVWCMYVSKHNQVSLWQRIPPRTVWYAIAEMFDHVILFLHFFYIDSALWQEHRLHVSVVVPNCATARDTSVVASAALVTVRHVQTSVGCPCPADITRAMPCAMMDAATPAQSAPSLLVRAGRRAFKCRVGRKSRSVCPSAGRCVRVPPPAATQPLSPTCAMQATVPRAPCRVASDTPRVRMHARPPVTTRRLLQPWARL